MVFTSVELLITEAEERKLSLGKYALELEAVDQEIAVEEVYAKMAERLKVMEASVAVGLKGERSVGGLVGGQGLKYWENMQAGKTISDNLYGKVIAYALSVGEANASMGVIVACPTAGSSGVLPSVFFSLKEKYELTEQAMVEGLAAAGAVGLVIANNASVSGAQGGCQAECGSAAMMAVFAATEMLGGTPRMGGEAGAMALKGMLGLVCDPVAGLVEVPCVKRNVAAAVQAVAAADMALAGITSTIPIDEVIEAMAEISKALPATLRETARGGLAVTPTGLSLKKKIFKR